jgi:peptide/nickel transport system substrate-binding protein
MKSESRMLRHLALLTVIGLVLAACGSTPATTTAGGGATTTAAAPSTTAGSGTTTATTAAAEAAMTLTFDIHPDAAWSDGTPITVADFQCNLEAIMNTPGSLSTAGYDQIISIDAGSSDKQVVMSFSNVYAAYKTLFVSIFPAHAVSNCADISGDFGTELPISGREWMIESWSEEQLVLVPNTSYWNPDRAPIAQRVVMVPKEDSDTEIASLLSGESDFIFPQAYAGITEALDDPNVSFVPGYGTNYEGLYFQQLDGPFADDDYRQAFFKSIDRNFILENIYDPIFPGAPLLQCGLWVPTVGPWCQNDQFTDSYDPAGAEQIMTDAGWTRNADGFWEKDGVVPEVRWMINEGNTRRETTQAIMIPAFAEAGFNVIPDNSDADTVFQIRLPALDYDLGMYINTAAPDPSVTAIMACENVPGPENNNQGQNSTGWCNEEATDLMHQADQATDEATRADLTHQIGQFLVDDAVMAPLFQFPNVAAWRTDALAGDTPGLEASNYRAFGNNLYAWEPIDGTDIIIGAEQWPGCLNPITECANSSWYVWTTAFLVLPSIWDATADGQFVPTDLVTGEPVVEVLG